MNGIEASKAAVYNKRFWRGRCVYLLLTETSESKTVLRSLVAEAVDM